MRRIGCSTSFFRRTGLAADSRSKPCRQAQRKPCMRMDCNSRGRPSTTSGTARSARKRFRMLCSDMPIARTPMRSRHGTAKKVPFFIGICRGVFDLFMETFLRLLARPEVFQCIGDPEREIPQVSLGPSPRDAKLLTCSIRGYLWALTPRVQAAMWMANNAVNFCILHEIRHVIGGDLPLDEQAGAKPIITEAVAIQLESHQGISSPRRRNTMPIRSPQCAWRRPSSQPSREQYPRSISSETATTRRTQS